MHTFEAAGTADAKAQKNADTTAARLAVIKTKKERQAAIHAHL
jgi:hypothetical protein